MAAAGLILLGFTPLLFVIATDKVGTTVAMLAVFFGLLMLILGSN